MLRKIIKKNRLAYKTVRKIYPYYSYFKNKKILDKNKELENKYADERCFVVGNGPSINQQDLTKLKNEHVFVCNHFYFHNQIDVIKPIFYSMVEPIILNDIFREKFFPKTMERINSYASLNPNAIFFFNIQYKNYIENNNLFLKNKIYYFLFSGSISNRMNLKMSKPNPSGKGVIYFMLAMARYLGFKTIYIIGCDWDHILDGYEKHFYSEDLTFQKKISKLEYTRILYEDLVRLDIFYRYFQKEGIQIFNAGIGGMIDTFPRIDYDSLFKI